MLVGGDLVFRFVVFGVAVVLPVVFYLIRRKWRSAAARREEVRRLLVLASEETARAEFEATAGYYGSSAVEDEQMAVPEEVQLSSSPTSPLPGGVGVKVLYPCAVCFSPTTTRCSKCKAVRYCSGKCQIIHWRQGHKDECRPSNFINQQVNNVGGSPARKVLQQDINEDYVDSFETVGNQFPYKAERFSGEPIHSSSSCIKDLDNNVGVAHQHGENATSISTSASSESSEASVHSSLKQVGVQPVNSSSFNLETETFLNKPVSTVSQNNVTATDKYTQTIHEPGGSDTQVRSLNSHVRKLDGSNVASVHRPTKSSGFWEGTIRSKKSRLDLLDDSEHFNDESVHTMKPGCRYSFDLGINRVDSCNKQSFIPRSIISDEADVATLGMKKPIDEVIISKETGKTVLKSTRAASFTSEMKNRVANTESVLVSSYGTAYSPSASTVEGHSSSKDAEKLSTSHSSSPKSNQVHNNKNMQSRRSESLRSSSLCSISPGVKPSKQSGHCPLGVKSEMAGRYSFKGIFPYEVFVDLYNWKKVELRPCGLINCGNSCYANVVLQCLMFTPSLNAFFLEASHSKACDERKWCFACEFERLVLKARHGSSPLSPIQILSQIRNIGSRLTYGREEDAHEFLTYAIDSLQSACLGKSSLSTSGSEEEETTLIGLIFGGYLRSKITCMTCGDRSERHERMMDLSVEIEGDIGTLEEALNKFTCPEILDGDNKYKCSSCNSYVKAKKKLSISESPNVLTITLKRYKLGELGKLSKPIRFREILNMAPYVSGTRDKGPVYRLYGVVVHIAPTAHSGHYVSYVKNVQNRWFKISDSVVEEVELRNVLSEGAYMLFYARCSPRAPRCIRNSVVRDPRADQSSTSKSRSLSPEPWDVTRVHHFTENSTSQPVHRIKEEDMSSEVSSGLFSESVGSTTGSSKRISSSNDDMFDHIFGDLDLRESRQWRNSSDSDTSSSSSFPSPLCSRHSPLADSNRYDSSGLETSASQVNKGAAQVERHADGHGKWSSSRSRSCNSSGSRYLYSDNCIECKKFTN